MPKTIDYGSYLYICLVLRIKNIGDTTMTTMELEAQKAMLAREILSIDDMELVKKLKTYLVRIGAKSKTKKDKYKNNDAD